MLAVIDREGSIRRPGTAAGQAPECGDCRNRGPACGNCVFGAVILAPDDAWPSFDADERAAIAALAGQGMVPPLRLAPVVAA